MSDCQFYKEKKWKDYLGNRLDREELEAVQFHLLHCAACRAELERMRAMIRLLDVNHPVEKKIYFWQQSTYRVAATIGLLVALSAGGFFYLHTSPAGEEYPVQIAVPPDYHSVDSVKIDSIRIKPDSIIEPLPK